MSPLNRYSFHPFILRIITIFPIKKRISPSPLSRSCRNLVVEFLQLSERFFAGALGFGGRLAQHFYSPFST